MPFNREAGETFSAKISRDEAFELKESQFKREHPNSAKFLAELDRAAEAFAHSPEGRKEGAMFKALLEEHSP